MITPRKFLRIYFFFRFINQRRNNARSRHIVLPPVATFTSRCRLRLQRAEAAAAVLKINDVTPVINRGRRGLGVTVCPPICAVYLISTSLDEPNSIGCTHSPAGCCHFAGVFFSGFRACWLVFPTTSGRQRSRYILVVRTA